MYEPCEICGADDWDIVVYEGPVRSGSFGKQTDDGRVLRCGSCLVDRLDESVSIASVSYENDDYRADMNQGLKVEDFFNQSDPGQIFNLSAVWPMNLREKIIADIGCGAGSFLSHVSGLAKHVVAIEPTKRYHNALKKSGYAVFSYVKNAQKKYLDSLDIAFAIQVIEHVENPREFLSEISSLLKPGSHLIIITPNRDDILLKLLPEEFPPFYYRTAHRWYFDQGSLHQCVELAGLQVESERYLQTYGMSNALLWMKERRPCGFTRLNGINQVADHLWNGYLESTGQANNIVVSARKK